MTNVPPPPKPSFFVRHWRGEDSLKRSFWLNFSTIYGVMFLAPIVALSSYIFSSYAEGRDTLVASMTFLLKNNLLITVLLCLYNALIAVWACVGLWRSANAVRLANPQSRNIWARLAQSLCIVVLVFQAVSIFGEMVKGINAPDLSAPENQELLNSVINQTATQMDLRNAPQIAPDGQQK